MIDLEQLTTAEARAYAAALRDALGEVDRDIDGRRREHGILGAGRRLHKRMKAAEEIAATGDVGIERPEAIRQSLIAKFDQCPLSTKFELQSNVRQSSDLSARGVLFHDFAARAINLMREHGESSIGVDQAMELLTEVIAQRDIPDEEVVHLPMRELRWLRVLVTKWAYQHEFSIERVVDVERRLHADIEVVGPHGQRYTRTITGKPDVLIAGPGAAEATVLDWKSGFAPPNATKPKVDELTGEVQDVEDRLSDMGYVQQVVYGVLVLLKYPAIQQVREREWYVFHNEVREATVYRWQLEQILDVLAGVVSQLDAAIDGGPKSKRWLPVAGTHCSFCLRPRDCPIRDEVGAPATLREAQRTAQEWIVAGQIRTERLPYLKGWVDKHGPIPIAHSKGRREVGWVKNKTGNGRRFAMYEPQNAPESPFDPLLEAAAREAGVLLDE